MRDDYPFTCSRCGGHRFIWSVRKNTTRGPRRWRTCALRCKPRRVKVGIGSEACSQNAAALEAALGRDLSRPPPYVQLPAPDSIDDLAAVLTGRRSTDR